MVEKIRYISVCGMLGYGYPVASLQRGLERNVDFIAADNGSTDPGPYYLGSGTGFVKEMQIRRDLEPALKAALDRKIPLIIGSAGGAGAKPHVDAFLEILRDIASQNALHFKLAVIYADIDKHVISDALAAGRISPCGPVPELTQTKIENCSNPVAQMGTEPIIEALQNNAEVIIIGRCCDTAVFAAYPIMKGLDPGLALHCAKIAECGALCARPAGANDSLYCELHKEHFIVEPLNGERKCTPDSVAGHSLYEQPNPECFFEPEGEIDMRQSEFEPITEHAVRVSGTRLRPAATETVKLEAAELKGYRSITIAGLRDPGAIKNIDLLCDGVRENVKANLQGVIDEAGYELIFRRYGIDAVTWTNEEKPSVPPREVGLVIEAIAPTPKMADNILSLARSTALHQPFPGRKATAGNLAFPFSPSDLQGGAVYEFSVYHLMEVDAPKALFPARYIDI